MTLEAEGAAPAIVRDHAFTPRPDTLGGRDAWWTLCGHRDGAGRACTLGEAAHAETAGPSLAERSKGLAKRCPDCVTKGVDPCPHVRP